MADKKISQLTALSAANLAPSTDVLAIVDTSATETKKIVAQDLVNGVLNVASAVGIGTSSPAVKLEVLRGSEGEYLRAGGDDTGNNGRGLRFTSSTNGGFIGAKHTLNAPSAGGAIAFATASTERAVIDSSGNLGIGTSSPGTKLQVNGSARLLDNQPTISFWKDGTPTKAASIEFNTARGDSIGLGVFNGSAWAFSLFVDANANALAGQPSLATTATNGFLYVPTCAGTPTGTPTAITGMAPIVVNTTNNKLYFYSGGAWRDAGP
jgi:hypothetical protein